MKKFLIVPAMLICSFAAAQNVTVKSSPASDALNHAAADAQTSQKALEVMFNQARSSVDTNQKGLQEDLQKKNANLLMELKADKKYRPQIDEIEALQKKLQSSSQEVQAKYQQDSQPLQVAIAKDEALMDGLIPVVRQENGLPDTATYDRATQKWTTTKPAEPKK